MVWIFLGPLQETHRISAPIPQSDCQVPLQPQVTPPNMEEYLTTIHMAQFTSQMNKFRVYLSLARTLDYSISDEVTKVNATLDFSGFQTFCYEPSFCAESNIE